MREQEALATRAAQVEQAGALLFGLDAFGDHFQAQRPGQRQHRAHHRGAAVLAHRFEFAHERAVDLQRVQREAMQVAQRGLAGAEIVQRRQHAGLAQGAEGGEDLVGIFQQRVLGDLDADAAGFDAVRLQLVEQLLGQGR